MGHKSMAMTANDCHATEAGKRQALFAAEKSAHITVTWAKEAREPKLVNR
jgi:hypothetical protein